MDLRASSRLCGPVFTCNDEDRGRTMARTDWKTLFDAIDAAGWKRRPCKHGVHVFLANHAARPITIPGAPGEFRALQNARAALRRAGLATL